MALGTVSHWRPVVNHITVPQVAGLAATIPRTADDGPGDLGHRDILRLQTDASPMDVDVYFEQQDGSQLCAVHCVNNLLQGAVFTELDFAAIGQRPCSVNGRTPVR